MSESTAIDRWINTLLAADAALAAVVGSRIYADQAPDGTPLPMVVYQMQSSRDLMVLGGHRVWANALYVVRGIGQTIAYAGNVITIADRIDAVLHRASGSTVEGVVFACVREGEFRMTESANGVQYRHLGGLYRILAKAS